MNQLGNEFVNPIAPRMNKIRAIAVTATSARHDMAVSTEVWTDVIAGRSLIMTADGGDVYFFFHNADAGTVDEANTTQGNANQCEVIHASMSRKVRPPFVPDGAGATVGLCQWLVVKGSVACTLRISVDSEDPANKY